MATELKSPPEPRTSRSERAVEDQINRIEKQIRWIDVGTGVFGLLVTFGGSQDVLLTGGMTPAHEGDSFSVDTYTLAMHPPPLPPPP